MLCLVLHLGGIGISAFLFYWKPNKQTCFGLRSTKGLHLTQRCLVCVCLCVYGARQDGRLTEDSSTSESKMAAGVAVQMQLYSSSQLR